MSTLNLNFGRVLHGGDYNPEQWPREVWDEDVRLMKETGVNIATLPVFGWATLQSAEDVFHFEWLDAILDKLHENGIGACLATATAMVPAWVARKYPSVLVVDQRGQARKHGNRHEFCPHSSDFGRLSTNLARKMAERYGHHPALKLWHVSNEYGTLCYCDKCAAAFRVYLQERYGDLKTLNARWNTIFWGHTYTAWEEIETPTENGERGIHGQTLDYARFQSGSLLGCYRAEAAVLRSITPHIPITTNMMGTFKPLNYHEWAKEVDIVSWDSYPRKNGTFSEIAFSHSLMRGLKEGQSWLLMEQTPSQQNWQAQCALKKPGVMRLWSYQAIAHGSDAVMYFQWRRSRGGIEKFHGAVVEHAGRTDARVFQEVAALGAELEKLGTQTLGARVESDIALLFDWENWWAIEDSKGPSVDLKYVPQCLNYFEALHERGLSCDVVSSEADLSNYKMIVAPLLYMVKPGVAEKLSAFVAAGGTLVTTFFSGLVDETDLIHLGGYPGPLREMTGIWAEEIDALMSGERNRAVFSEPFGELSGEAPCGLLCDIVHLEGARALAHYGDDFYAGSPALTVNDFGAGKAYYVATSLEKEALGQFLGEVCAQNGIKAPLPTIPAGVEVTTRVSSEGNALLYVLNHNTTPVKIALENGYFDLISEKSVQSELDLAAYGVAILKAA